MEGREGSRDLEVRELFPRTLPALIRYIHLKNKLGEESYRDGVYSNEGIVCRVWQSRVIMKHGRDVKTRGLKIISLARRSQFESLSGPYAWGFGLDPQ